MKYRVTSWQIWLLSLLLMGTVSCGQQDPELAPLKKAAAWLWDQQGEDGGWHSPAHGLMKSGQVSTAFVLFALMQIPEDVYQPDDADVERALEFMRQHIMETTVLTSELGVLGISDPDVLEYPNYATAYALRLFHFFKDADLTKKMQTYLAAQQFDESRMIGTGNPAYGGWGFGELVLPRNSVGHIDISNTRKALEALRATGYKQELLYRKGLLFLRYMQKHPSGDRPQPEGQTAGSGYDGGFYYSPVVLDANKGGLIEGEDGGYRSYATATCDGLLGLIAVGVADTAERFRRAKQWLFDHPLLERAEGIPLEDPAEWYKTIFYYHLMCRGEVYAKTGGPEGWQNDMRDILIDKQREDGSYLNPEGARNKEDDPQIATAMSIIAWCRLLGFEEKL